MGIQQRMSSGGNIAKAVGITINKRVVSPKPVSSYQKHQVISRSSTKKSSSTKMKTAPTAVTMGIEQRMASSGDIAEHVGVTINPRVDSQKHIDSYEKGELISRTAPKPTNKGNVLDVMRILGPGGLAKVYVAGGAFGSKAATKTVFEEYWKAEDYPMEHLDKIWGSKEWKEWQPKTTVPFIPSIQIPEVKLPVFKWPDLSGIGKWLLIGGAILAVILIIPALISGVASRKATEKVIG